MTFTRLAATPFAALALLLGAAVLAPASAGQADGIRLAQAQSFSDAKLQSFAVAALEVREIRDDYVARIRQAESEDQRQQLAQQANSEMVAAVQSASGISVEEYNAIIQAASDDEELSARIREQIESATQ